MQHNIVPDGKGVRTKFWTKSGPGGTVPPGPDVSDKDVLRRLILHENAMIHIFYPDEPEKKEMAKQISNLIKIIDAEKLIQMTRGKNRTIEFIPVH